MIMRPQLVVTVLAAVATFATVLTLALPLLSRDRTQQRMRVMATERDKMRAARMADFAKDGGTARLRQVNKGFMQQIVDKLNLRSAFESDEIKSKLKDGSARNRHTRFSMSIIREARRQWAILSHHVSLVPN